MFSTVLRFLQSSSHNLITKNNGINQVCHKSSSPLSTLPQNQINTNEELKRMVWVDMEMTGLDISKDHILEIACIVTDADLNIIAEGPNLILHQPSEVLEKMNPWCIEAHRKSGLTEASLKSNITLSEAENTVLNFVSNHVGQGVCPLAGNSVYMDRLFIRRLLPRLDNYLHYRIIDVSTVKELCKRWAPTVYQTAPKKAFTHRALDDIKESINELKHYKTKLFKNLV